LDEFFAFVLESQKKKKKKKKMSGGMESGRVIVMEMAMVDSYAPVNGDGVKESACAGHRARQTAGQLKPS
jgi:hypothetical protein